MSYKRQELLFLCGPLGSAPGFGGSVLLIVLVFFAMFFFFVCLRHVSCVPNDVIVSGLLILDCHFGNVYLRNIQLGVFGVDNTTLFMRAINLAMHHIIRWCLLAETIPEPVTLLVITIYTIGLSHTDFYLCIYLPMYCHISKSYQCGYIRYFLWWFKISPK